MLLKQRQLAALCGVKPPAISRFLKSGSLHAIDRKMDMSDPANMAYLQKHNPKAAQDILKGIDPFSSGIETTPGTDETEAKDGQLKEKHAVKQPKKQNPTVDRQRLSALKEEAEQDYAEETLGPTRRKAEYSMSYEEEVISKRAFYEAEKIKNDAALKALELDKRNGAVIETELVLDIITRLAGSIQKGLLDPIPKQALLICSRLGAVGRESEVEDIIATDNSRAIEDIKNIVDNASRAKWGARNARIEKAEKEEESD